MKIIEVKNVSKFYNGEGAVSNTSFTIDEGEFVTILGPSGSGKTTILRMLAGFEMASSGTILIDGKDMTKIPPNKRPVNTVFQKYALFPHLDVFENIAFGLKLKRIKVNDGERLLSVGEIKSKVQEALSLVGLKNYGDRDIDNLSGGQQQRVAIARAIVNEPKVLLLDEPLSALDLKMRQEMRIELRRLHKELGITFIFVTHDQEEAMTMSDRIIVMKDGIIQQIGTPKQIYDEPSNAFVADFIGDSNIIKGKFIKDFQVEFLGKKFECVDKGFKRNEIVDVVLRPESIEVVKKDAQIEAKVLYSIFEGSYYNITVEIKKQKLVIETIRRYEDGAKIGLWIEPDEIHLMRSNDIEDKEENKEVENGEE
ncbi:MAG: ABC transporter ATP-binding protein [Christensenellaceae bacterium]|jgi:spermidine/putrescine transport system ATP-binding protein|nr:ABC transporter ATP-binding protein [Christensenellaceae bacterium]